MEPWDLLLRVALAAVAGMALGLERQRGGHPAGARTHLLVAVGACMFTLAGAYGFRDIDRVTPWDPARIAAQVASGIGFVGAGAILRDGGSTRGLTTAATLWISGAIGVCMGAGLFVTTALAVVIVILALVALAAINDWRKRSSDCMAEISVTYRGTEAPYLLWEAIRASDARLDTIQEYADADDGTCTLVVTIVLADDLATLHTRAATVSSAPGVQSLRIMRA